MKITNNRIFKKSVDGEGYLLQRFCLYHVFTRRWYKEKCRKSNHIIIDLTTDDKA
tara:strand:+ start:438 stop:602 length:165 start_codon:yes stop_codon:yes gene_type:complete